MASRCRHLQSSINNNDYENDIKVEGAAGSVGDEVKNNSNNNNNNIGNSDHSNVVLVRITGPDATQKRAKRLPFSHSIYGRTTVSASGIAIRFPTVRDNIHKCSEVDDDDDDSLYVVTSAHLFAAFRSAASTTTTNNTNGGGSKLKLERTKQQSLLLKDTIVDVLVDNSGDTEQLISENNWFKGNVVAILPIAEVSSSIDRLTCNDDATWTVGWTAASTSMLLGSQAEVIGNNETFQQNAWTTFAESFGHVTTESKWGSADEIALIKLIRNKDRVLPKTFGQWSAVMPARGQQVAAIGSPYGMMSPQTFMNAISLGIVSNVVFRGENPSLILTDVRCLPGQEGGALVANTSKLNVNHLIGMIIPPIRRIDARAVTDFNFAIPINEIYDAVLAYRNREQPVVVPSPTVAKTSFESSLSIRLDSQYRLPTLKDENFVRFIESAERSLVMVKIGGNWASGVVISDDGYIVTNAHLFAPFVQSIDKQAPTQQIQFKGGLYPMVRVAHYRDDGENSVDRLNSSGHSSFTWLKAEVVFISSSHLDIALLRVIITGTSASIFYSSLLNPVPISETTSFAQGQTVYVIGYPVFSPSTNMDATCTKGIISKVISVHKMPAILVTSAAVHAGNSGGLLIDENGYFLGLVTCNMKVKDGITIPRLNFSIAVNYLKPIFEYVNSNDYSFLRKLDVFDEEFEAVWKLKRPLVPKVTHPPASAKFKQFMEQYGNKKNDDDASVDDGNVSISTNESVSCKIRSRL